MRNRIHPFAGPFLGLMLAASCYVPLLEAAPTGAGATIKKFTGDAQIQINGSETRVRMEQSLALPVAIRTGDSRIMLTMPGRLIAIGKNSSCTISKSGNVLIKDGLGGAVAVQPADKVVQQITYRRPTGNLRASASPWPSGNFEEGADEGGAAPITDDEGDADVAQTDADLIALLSSLAVAFAPAADRGGYFKVMLFEGHAEVQVKDEAPIQLQPNEMSQAKVDKGGEMDGEIRCDAFNLEVAVETSALINDFRECWDMGPVEREIARQQEEIRRGDYLSFRRNQARRGPSTAVEDRQIIRGLRKSQRGGKH